MESKLAVDLLAWLFNISSAILVIFVNKELMVAANFRFATTLAALHFLSSGACTRLWTFFCTSNDSSAKKSAQPSVGEIWIFAAIGNASLVGLNFSLLYNTLGFYQLTKLLIAPSVCLIEFVWLGKRICFSKIIAIAVVICGISIVSVTGETNLTGIVGLMSACFGVVGSSVQAVLVREMQERHRISSVDLLSHTSPIQGASLLLLAPFLDWVATRQWITAYRWDSANICLLLLSCFTAVLLNISQYTVLGRFRATTYAVVGHVKTVLVLLGGWMFFHERMTWQQAAGIAVAVAGLLLYGYRSERLAMPQTDLHPVGANVDRQP